MNFPYRFFVDLVDEFKIKSPADREMGEKYVRGAVDKGHNFWYS
jgi:hypothetical protein